MTLEQQSNHNLQFYVNALAQLSTPRWSVSTTLCRFWAQSMRARFLVRHLADAFRAQAAVLEQDIQAARGICQVLSLPLQTTQTEPGRWGVSDRWLV